ncbi:hypothetical protein LINPERHAP1_LOCUS25208 [Linum perenne]
MQEDVEINPRCPRVSFSEEEIRSFYRPWLKALVVKVLEKTFSFQTVKRRLEILWARAGQIQVADATNNVFLVRFSDPDDYKSAAFGSPWKIYDYYFSVARWSPSFNEEESFKTILTWVRLPKLPIHYFNNLAVTRIDNHIGKTVKIDMATTEGARGRYARVCVEVDLSKPLIGKYMIEDRILNVEYESLENIFFTCGHYGHKMDTCPSIISPQGATEMDKQAEEISNSNKKEEEGDLGVWRTVQRRQKGKKSTLTPITNVQTPKGSRFVILSREKETIPSNSTEPATTTTQKLVDPVIAAHAAKLTEILQQGVSSTAHVSTSPGNSSKPVVPAVPLADITNVAKSKKADKVSGGGNSKKSSVMPEANLISVPVTYENPVFQEMTVTQARTGKTGVRRGKPNPACRINPNASQLEKKDTRVVRNFIPQPKQYTENINGGEKKGDPPDKA